MGQEAVGLRNVHAHGHEQGACTIRMRSALEVVPRGVLVQNTRNSELRVYAQ